MNTDDWLDEDGYPTEETLTFIETWDWRDVDLNDLFEFIGTIWWMPEFGWTESVEVNDFGRTVHRYRLATGGWSGNESIIRALQANFIVWGLTWESSSRGGLHIFEVRIGNESKDRQV